MLSNIYNRYLGDYFILQSHKFFISSQLSLGLDKFRSIRMNITEADSLKENL